MLVCEFSGLTRAMFLLPTGPMLRNLSRQLVAFERSQWPFDRDACQQREEMLRPVTWWSIHGRSTGDLRQLAERVLSQDCSASACERNWSTWALYHTQRRNRLSIEQCRRLVFVNTNGRMLRRTRTEGQMIEVSHFVTPWFSYVLTNCTFLKDMQ